MDETFAAMLLTQGGIAVVVALVVKLLVKKPLRLRLGLPEEGSNELEDPLAKRKYAVWLNSIAVVLGVGLAVLATFIFGEPTGAGIMSAVIVGLFGAASAVGVSEFGSNATALRK